MMNSNKSRSYRGGKNKRSCNGCRYQTHDRECGINIEMKCAVDGNFEYWEPSFETCKKCVWSTDVSGKLFCIFTQGTCMRYDPILNHNS